MENDELIKIKPDLERVKSILKMVEIREKRVKFVEGEEFASLNFEDIMR